MERKQIGKAHGVEIFVKDINKKGDFIHNESFNDWILYTFR